MDIVEEVYRLGPTRNTRCGHGPFQVNKERGHFSLGISGEISGEVCCILFWDFSGLSLLFLLLFR